jgi:queuine tRNA-ribosyltransferase
MALRKLKIDTLHGTIDTPAFLPDATYGAINSISFDDAKSSEINELVTNTLHLELNPGSEYIQEFGGLHKFFNWDRPILTDSGGFQAFSLIHRRSNKNNFITNEGVHFKDFKTGKKYLLTPETSQQIQHKLNSDIRVVLDEPLALDADIDKNKKSVERTTKWAIRNKNKFLELNRLSKREFEASTNQNQRPLLSAVVQGANDYELRKRSADELIEIGFDMYNFGGFPLKDNGELDLELSEYLVNLLPKGKPRYAMGIGTPDDIIKLAHMGWDLFDCVLPTRNARHGYLYVPQGEGDQDYENYSVVHIKSKRYAFSDEPISSISKTHPLLKNISKAYLRHLIRIKEPSGFRLATINNLYFYSSIIKKLRDY